MKLRFLLCDLDNTLYPASSGMEDRMVQGMNDFVCRWFGVGLAEAQKIRRRYRERYGSSLRGLLVEGGLPDAERYLEAIHPQDVGEILAPDPGLARTLTDIRLRRVVLTNAPAEHATRVMRFLGVEDQFERVFDIRFSDYVGKPDHGVFRKVLAELAAEPAEAELVDDGPQHVRSFRLMGGQGVLVDEAGVCDEGPAIRKIAELPAVLTLLG